MCCNMSLLDDNLDIDHIALKILCVSYIKKGYIGDIKVKYEDSDIDISDILDTPDKFILGKSWDQFGRQYKIKIFPYMRPNLSEFQLKLGYYKGNYLLSTDNLLSVILTENC